MAETSPKKAIVVIVVLLILIGAGIFYLDGKNPPGAVTDERLAALQAAISGHVAKYGAPPEALSALPEGTPLVDVWKNPFTYRVLEDGQVEISSLGGDGEPGGHMFKADKITKFRP